MLWYVVAQWMLICVTRIHEVNCVFTSLKYYNPCVHEVIIISCFSLFAGCVVGHRRIIT